MKRNPLAVLLAALVLATASLPAAEAPAPSEVPVNWELDIEYEKPMPLRVDIPGERRARTFWFMRYTVSNHTGEDQIFVPDFALYTDTGQLLRAGRNVPHVVFEKIKSAYDDPLLKDMTAMTGKLLQGDDNAKSGVAIWPDFDTNAGTFDIFIGGLSGETAEIELPTPITVTEMDYTGKVETITKTTAVLTKTLNLEYTVPGEAAARIRSEATLVTEKWVMR